MKLLKLIIKTWTDIVESKFKFCIWTTNPPIDIKTLFFVSSLINLMFRNKLLLPKVVVYPLGSFKCKILNDNVIINNINQYL